MAEQNVTPATEINNTPIPTSLKKLTSLYHSTEQRQRDKLVSIIEAAHAGFKATKKELQIAETYVDLYAEEMAKGVEIINKEKIYKEAEKIVDFQLFLRKIQDRQEQHQSHAA